VVVPGHAEGDGYSDGIGTAQPDQDGGNGLIVVKVQDESGAWATVQTCSYSGSVETYSVELQ
jgi:hypothetical protein